MKLVKTIRYFLCLSLVLLNVQVLANNHGNTNVRFTRLSPEQGLSQEAILSIYQDNQGYMWFGTQEGLNRFNGYEFEVFTQEFTDPNSLTNDWVFSIAQDADENLWIGTDGGGLNRFNPESRNFTAFRHANDNPKSVSDNVIRVLFLDKQQRFWIGTDNGLNRLADEQDEFLTVYLAPSPSSGLKGDLKIRALAQDQKGFLWVGTDGLGLFRLNPENGNVEHYFKHQEDSLVSSNRVFSLLVDSDNRVWVGYYDNGLSLINSERTSARQFITKPDDPQSLSHNLVRSIYQDKQGQIWIATDNGLEQWSPSRNGFIHFQHSPEDLRSLSNNKITAIYQDKGDVLWVGSYSGINKWNTATGNFVHYRVSQNPKFSLSNNGVNAFTQSADGDIWIATYGGLNRLQLSDGTIQHYLANEDDSNSVVENRIMSLHADNNGSVWIGTRASGFSRLDLNSGKFSHFRHSPNDSNSPSANAITKIISAGENQIWIGTWGGGLNHYDFSTDSFTHYRHDLNDDSSISSDRILDIYKDRLNNLWVGTWGGGISIYNSEMQLEKVLKLSSEPDSLSENKIWTILEDRNNNIWIGTQGGGLNLLRAANREVGDYRFERFSRSSGLPSNVIYGLVEGENGFIWASTNRGISKIDPSSSSIVNYDESHGLQSNEFNSGAFYKDSSGRIYFGGVNGVTAFSPADIKANEHQPPVVIDQFLRIDERIPLSNDHNEQLTVGHLDYFIAFEFSALDYAEPAKNQYAYKLDGFDRDWIQTQQLRRATYTNLPSGEYIFRVKAANNDGIWNEQGNSLKLKVLPPPWKTWWAYSIYTGLILILLLATINALLTRQKRAREYHKTLENEVQKRTRELTELNRQLHSASISDALTGLKNRTYLLSVIEHEMADIKRKIHAQAKDDPETDSQGPRIFFLMLDLDDFKKVNDEHGNNAGDFVIKEVSTMLLEFFRTTDSIIRWGSDEFLIVGQVTDIREINRMADRLQQNVKNHHFDLHDKTTIRVTCSIGFAAYPFYSDKPDLMSWEEVQMIAHQAAQISKLAGKDTWTGLKQGALEMEAEQISEIAQNSKKMIKDGYINIVEFHSYNKKPF